MMMMIYGISLFYKDSSFGRDEGAMGFLPKKSGSNNAEGEEMDERRKLDRV